MPSRESVRRNNGVSRRRLRGVLHIWTTPRKSRGSGGSMSAAVIDKIDKSTETFRDKILRKCGESVEMKEKFFEKYAGEIEELSREMARRFLDGKKLLTMGNGGSLADAIHFTVEFTHSIDRKSVVWG